MPVLSTDVSSVVCVSAFLSLTQTDRAAGVKIIVVTGSRLYISVQCNSLSSSSANQNPAFRIPGLLLAEQKSKVNDCIRLMFFSGNQ